MNNIINKLLVVGDKFMPEKHSKPPGFTYNAHGPFTKKRVRIRKNFNWFAKFLIKHFAG